MRIEHSPGPRCQVRRGAVALEFIIVSMIFVLALLGIVELSRFIMVRQVLVNAAREGVRRAVVPGATDADLTGTNGVITKYVQGAKMGGTITATTLVNGSTASLSTASSHDTIAVQLSVPFSDVSWGIMQFIPGSAQLVAEVTMRKE